MTIGLSYLDDLGRVRIEVSDRPNGAVSVERSANELLWTVVRGGVALPLIGGAATLDDYEFYADVQNFYRIAQVSLEDAVDVFTASGTWNKPPGLTAAKITVVGGGGAGGGSVATIAGQGSFGNGGTAGVIAVSVIDAAALGASETVTVGAGGVGASGAVGGSGLTSSLGAHVSADGGVGGAVGLASSNDGWGGGTPSPTTGTGQVVAPGQAGGAGVRLPTLGSATARGGYGGSGRFGAGGRGSVNAGPGGAALGFGAGGGGASGGASAPARTGGNGAPGLVIVEHIFAD